MKSYMTKQGEYKKGWDLYTAGMPITKCQNANQVIGWANAQAEKEEKEKEEKKEQAGGLRPPL